MSPNPNALDDVKVPDPSFMDDYDTGSSDYIRPPQAKVPDGKGKFKFQPFLAQAPSADKIRIRDAEGKPLKTRDGYLKIVVEGIKLVESGYEIRQTHIGTAQYKKYKNGAPTGELRNASPFMDYLRAHGIELKPASVEDYQNYAESTADRQFQVTIDWDAYDNDAKENVAEKWEDFPVDPENPEQRLPFVEKNGKRFWARANVKRFVSAV